MKAIAMMAAAAALTGLCACDRLAPSGATASNDKAGETPANRARAADKAPAASGVATGTATGLAAAEQRGLAGNPNIIPASSTLVTQVDRAFLIGRWTDARDCAEAGAFAADGRFTNAAGVGAQWTLEGDQLTITFAGAAPRPLRVSAIDQNTLNVVNPDGSVGRSTRC